MKREDEFAAHWLGTPTFFITITSFHDGYLMSGGFVGSRLP
jgi:hypothetical protein